MKILKLIALTLALAVSAIAQVNLSQPPGTYTNNSIPVRDGTGNKIKNADLLRYDGSGGNSTFRVGDTAYTINSNGYIETYASTTASLGAFVPGSRFQPWVTTSGFTIYGYRSGDAYSVMDYISSPNTLEITPNLILPASFIRPPTNVTITEASPDTGTFNIALANELATIDEATTLAFSANGTAGQRFSGSIVNSTGGALVATLTNCTPSTTTVAANSTQVYTFVSTGSAWVMPGGDPYTVLPVASGGTGSSTAATAATALGVGTGDSPQFTAVNVGAATDTTVTRVSAGLIAVEGNSVVTDNRIDTNAELRAIAVGLGAVVQANSSTFASPDTTTPRTLTAADCYGFISYYGATGTINLPAGVVGMNGIIYNTGAFTITIDPNGSEIVVRDGTAQTGGVSFTLSSGAGNYVAIHFDGTRWVTLGFKGTLSVGS